MAAENIDNTVNGTGLFPAKVPGLSDAADIQAALRLYHYGSYTYDGANTNTTNLVNPSIAKHLQNLVDADAAEVTNRNSAITTHNTATTSVHGIANTADLATKTYVNTAVSGAVGGVVGEFSNLAGTAIDWNPVDERFDVEPRLANSGTVITKTESFTLSPDDVGKTAILYSSNPMIVTLPANASVEIPVGYSIDIIQTGTGSVTVSEGSGAVSINSKSNIKSLDGQYSKGTLVKIADNTWFFFGNLLNVVTPVTPTAPTPVAPTPVAPTPTPPTPTPPTPTPPTPTPPTPTPPTPTPPTPTPPTPTPPTPTPPQLPTPTLSVTSQGWNSYPNAAYANITVGNFDYENTYTSTIGTQNPEFPEEWNLGNLNPNQSYTVYITASRAGYTSAQGSITFSANPASTPTPVAPTPTGPTTYNIYTYCDPLFPSMRGGAYGTQTAGTTVITGTTTTQGLTSEQIVAQLGYAGGCPTVPIVNPGTVYISYCYQGAPVVESYPINADNILTTNINEACSVYTTLLNNIGATSIDCSTSSARTAPTGCAPAPTPTPTPTCPSSNIYGVTQGGVYSGSCPDGSCPGCSNYQDNWYKCSDGSSGVKFYTGLGCTTPTPTPPVTTCTMPSVVGDTEIVASNKITTAGIAYEFTNYYGNNQGATAQNNGTVAAQDPAPGTTHSCGYQTNATLYIYQYTAPTPVAPTPTAPTPTSTIYYAYGCCNGDPVVIDGPNNNTARAEYQSATGCTAGGASTNYNTALANAQAACDAQTPTPVAPTPTAPNCQQCDGYSPYADGSYGTRANDDCYSGSEYYRVCITPSGCLNRTDTFGCVPSTPVAPTPVAPTPTAVCPPNDGRSYTNTRTTTNTCSDLGLTYVCTDGLFQYCLSATPVAPTPVAPTPVAPTPTASYPTLLSGLHYCAAGDAPNPASPCPSNGSGTGVNCVDGGASGSSCAPTPVAPTPVAPTPVAPTPTAPNCNYCDPLYSGGACGQYGNGTLCYTPSGCENRCDGDHPPVPAPVAPVAPTAPSRYTCTPSDYANQCCSCFSVGACDANGSAWPAC